jgi:probable HAF family extracellular repeat protein
MVSPPTATMLLGVAQTFMASVTATNGSVTWTIQEGSTGGSITNAGLYTAPQVAGTYHVIATSVADTSKFGGATINVIPPGQIMITSVPPNGAVGIPYGVPVQLCSGGTLQNLFELSASGGHLGRGGAYSWTGSSLPSGLQVYNIVLPGFPTCASGSFGAIEGRPTAAGTYTFSISVSDHGNPPATATKQYTIEISSTPTTAIEKIPADEARKTHHHYKLIDVGTFGGPASQYSVPSSAGLNNRGTATGVADTSIPDPNPAPNCFFDCYVDHAFVSKDGVTTDLGALPGGASSFAYVVNNNGISVGQSQSGSIDPLTGLPEVRGVLWQRGKILDLGTLGGNASNANAINDRNQVVGAATNETFDPFANASQAACQVLTTTGGCSGSTFSFNALFSLSTTETRAFLWDDGLMRDLGTLGGPDSAALIVNDQGEVAGWSYTSFVANPATGTPTVDPFLWSPEDGKMTDLGSLGGTFGAPFFMNNRGQVIGVSNLAGDLIVHPFIWSKSEGMKDLGTLGGTYGHPNWINDEGEVVGFAQFAGDQNGHAFLWRNGVMTDLGTIGTDPASEAGSINSRHQIVGGTFIFGGLDLHGWIWENGGPIVDLDTLTLPGSGLTVFAGNLINDRGEIAGRGRLPNGDEHAILLIPCDENHPDVEGCDYDSAAAENAAQLNPAPITQAPAGASAAVLSQPEIMKRRNHHFGSSQFSPK